MMKKNKLTIYLTVVIILFVCVLYVSLKDDYKDILNALNDVNILFLLIGVFFMFLSKYFLGETLYFLAKKEKSDIKIKDMVLIELIYPFFAGITPSSLGGESFEILYMRDCGISVGKGSNITIQKFITYQISLLIINTMAVILNLFIRVVPLNSFVFSLSLRNIKKTINNNVITKIKEAIIWWSENKSGVNNKFKAKLRKYIVRFPPFLLYK